MSSLVEPGRREPDRIRLEHVFNLRDLGGYRAAGDRQVARALIFRADGLHRLSPSDIEVVSRLGIRTVVDLRTAGEREDSGIAPLDELDATGHHLPLIAELWPHFDEDDRLDPVAYLVERYHEMTDEGAPVLARVLELLATDGTTPLVFHCSAGKDRTGVTAALILGVLGVDDDTIAHDYSITADAMEDLTAWVRGLGPDAVTSMEDQPKVFLACPAEAMAVFLAETNERFGSLTGYARSIGVTDEVIAEIRRRYLGPVTS
jgi:protein tyrosine/serine phosphatase